MCEKLNVDEKTIFKIYLESLAWSSQLMNPEKYTANSRANMLAAVLL